MCTGLHKCMQVSSLFYFQTRDTLLMVILYWDKVSHVVKIKEEKLLVSDFDN